MGHQPRGASDRVSATATERTRAGLGRWARSGASFERLRRRQTVKSSSRAEAPAKTLVFGSTPPTRTELLSNHCPKYGPESDALPDGATPKGRSWSGILSKR